MTFSTLVVVVVVAVVAFVVPAAVVVVCVARSPAPSAASARPGGRSDAADDSDDESAELWEVSEHWLLLGCCGCEWGCACGLRAWRLSGRAAPPLGAPTISTGAHTHTAARDGWLSPLKSK